jgi:hypothetical protein
LDFVVDGNGYTTQFYGGRAYLLKGNMSNNTCGQRELDALIAEEWAFASHAEEARAARVIAVRIRNSSAKEPILVWPFADAPKEFQGLSTRCNAEEWLALVPAHIQQANIAWLQGGTAFARFLVEEIRLLDGRRVYIGCRV